MMPKYDGTVRLSPAMGKIDDIRSDTSKGDRLQCLSEIEHELPYPISIPRLLYTSSPIAPHASRVKPALCQTACLIVILDDLTCLPQSRCGFSAHYTGCMDFHSVLVKN